MVVLGGMGNVWGVIVGALPAGLAEQQRPQQFGVQFDDWFGTDLAASRATTT